jgi:hypothetical protein
MNALQAILLVLLVAAATALANKLDTPAQQKDLECAYLLARPGAGDCYWAKK